MSESLGTLKSRLHDARKPLREAMMETATKGKMLPSIRWTRWWVSHLGCVKSCLEYLGIGMSDAWLNGGTGHAFIINVHDEVCPSGPTAWNTEMLCTLAPNLGYRETTVFGHKRFGVAEFGAAQEAAWKMVREAVDQGFPCFGWELDIPEYYVINGYDDVGYHYVGCTCQEGAGPKPWRELGDTNIGLVEVKRVDPCPPADDATAVRDMVQLVVKHASGPPEWRLSGYHTGPLALLAWADALQTGKAGRFGQGYNGAVWEECRRMGVAFLKEAKRRLPGNADSAFDEAIEAYSAVQCLLKHVLDAYPFEPGAPGTVQSDEAAALLRQAYDAESRGLEALQRIAAAL